MDFSAILAWISSAIVAVLSWLIDFVLWVPRKLFSLSVDLFLYLLSLIPDPGLSNAIGYVSSIAGHSGIVYFLSFSQVDIGLPLIIGVYIARFLIRRLPFIG